jgi:hypothetical protein
MINIKTVQPGTGRQQGERKDNGKKEETGDFIH